MCKKVILITGAGSGLGFELSLQLSKMGYIVFAGTRDTRKFKLALTNENINQNLNIVRLNVKSTKSIQKVINKMINSYKKIDVLINNASYALIGAVEELEINEIKKLFDVNYYGYIRVIQIILPYMRKEYSGHIINISSVSGVRANELLSGYCASKFAIEALSESLVKEMKEFNIKVNIIEPGLLNTKMFSNTKYINRLGDDSPYKKKVLDKLKTQEYIVREKSQEPYEAAKTIVELIEGNIENTFRIQTNEWSKSVVNSKLKMNSINEL